MNIQSRIKEYLKNRTDRKRWLWTVLCLAVVVSLITSAVMTKPAAAVTGELVCGKEEHTHSEECYSTSPKTIECDLEEKAHQHDEDCYKEEQVLTCNLEENENHTHTDDCYAKIKRLVCDKEEYICIHTHDENCYDEAGNLICSLEEVKEHEHDDDCYNENNELICGQREIVEHPEHAEECYTTDENGEKILSCTKVLAVKHQHNDECVHGGETVLTCGMEEHVHTEECYERADDEKTADLPGTDSETETEPLVFRNRETNVRVVVTADHDAFPEGTKMVVTPVKSEEVMEAVQDTVGDKKVVKVKAVDITFYCNGEAVEPSKPITVSMAATPVNEAQESAVVHIDNEGAADIVAESDSIYKELTFDTDSFSVYVLTYTVDFHYEVNGQTYDFSIPGGGYVTLQQLVEVLGITNDETDSEIVLTDDDNDEETVSAEVDEDNIEEVVEDNNEEIPSLEEEEQNIDDADETADAESASAESTDAQTEIKLTLSDVEISDRTRTFVADVESVKFSSPELVWVGNVGSDSTVGGLKEANNLECEYSAKLTEDEIEEINNSTIEAGDWALISLKPFTSKESLIITMKNGDQFVIKVTDAQDPSIYIDRKVIIYDNAEQRAMTSTNNTWDGYRNRFPSIPLSEADGTDAAHWTVERNNGNYYLKANNGQYLTINRNAVGLVDNWSVATPLGIQAGTNPDYRIYDANNYDNVLTYEPNGNYDGFFSAPGGTYSGERDTNRWLYIREVENVPDRAGDWLLYFDDDFDEITIHVGETVSLRPYNKWEWKEGDTNVQTAHWNIGGRDNNYWNQIDSDDDNGAHKESWDDGGTGNTAGFHWTAYVKKDDQLDTHYWAVQGQATQPGDYNLTNTKNGKTITVHVLEGTPERPKTINNIANIKVNLFDYDNGGELDVGLVNGQTNQNLANNSNFKSESVNQMGGSDHFYFLSSGSGNNNSESWNSYTKDRSNPGIVENTLDANGYPKLNHGSHTSLEYLFDTSQASQTWHGGSGGDGMIAYPDVVGMFQKDKDGYYYYNSNTNFFYYDAATGTSKLYEHTYTQNSSADKGALANDKPIGFFPFHEYNSTDDLFVNQNADLNHHVGMSMDIEFMLSNDRLDDYGKPIIFDFSGDDDLWVFVEWEDGGVKHSKLLLDLGGVHQPIHGDINFTDDANTDFIKPNHPYTLKVFYLERGGCDSNCSIRFNLPIIQDLTVAKKLTGLTEEEKVKYKDEEFWYEIVIDHKPYNAPQPYNYPNPDNGFEKVTLWDADGNDVTPDDFKIENGRFKLKDGQTLTISYLDRSDKFTVAELKTDNMENFERPNAERFFHRPHDASRYEEEITLNDSQTISKPITDGWVTPQYELENTDKVTFTNTLKEKNLEVEKRWVGEHDHPESITFKVSATVEDENGVRQPYAVVELKEEDGTTDKVFTLNDSNEWRHEIEHLPVNTPDGKFIFYDINEGHVDGYVLTGSRDLTPVKYNFCNIDVVKLWPDSNGSHTEVLQVLLKNSEGKYYAGVDDDGNALFVEDRDEAVSRQLKPENNYSQRYDRLPYEDYTAEQLHDDEYNHGLSVYRRAIIQYELENSPLEHEVNPTGKKPVIHKRIDALRDGVTNPDSAHTGEDLTDLYRLYLDYKVNSLQDPNGVDLLLIIDHSGSMNSSQWPGNEYRARAVMAALNGENGVISKFLAANDQNQWAAVGFKGPDGYRNYEFDLKNPWNPKENDESSNNNAGLNGSEVLSPDSDSYEFTRTSSNIDLDNEGPLVQSNYTAGFWRAEQFLLNSAVKEDGRKKVIVFISDGVPTLHIDNLNGSLENAGRAAGSPYYREEYGGCPDKALTEFGYFVSDMTGNGYSFGGDNGNMEFYSIGLGSLMQTNGSSDPKALMSGSELLKEMLKKAYQSEDVPDGHYMTISDAPVNELYDYNSVTDTLSKDLCIILGINETFSNLIIQDDLSKYVNLYELAGESDIMKAAKAKVTMTVPDQEAESGYRVITLYENGGPATSDEAKFIIRADDQPVPIIQKLQYDTSTKTVKAVFNPNYKVVEDVTYTLSFDVKTTEEAYTTYATDGYDKYTSGDKEGQVITGDKDTDFLGTDPVNATSVDQPGFRSNDEAKATYKHNNNNEEIIYPHPVIQVAAKVDIVKTDQSGKPLEGATFNLYDSEYDSSKTIEQNAVHLIEGPLTSEKPSGLNDAVIRSGRLSVGEYYLVEIHAPAGYISIPGPVRIIVTEATDRHQFDLNVSIAEQEIDSTKLVYDTVTHTWKLSLQNTAGYKLPSTGGPGTGFFTIFGILLIALAGLGLVLRNKHRLATAIPTSEEGGGGETS